MALPSILKVRRRHVDRASATGSEGPSKETSRQDVRPADLKRSTRTRRIFAFIASFSYFVAFIFLILVCIGNTHNRAVLNDVYFFKLDLTDIIPQSVPNAQLINSIARTIGLHDFYQVGLWNFCEGYKDSGVTFCSKPKNLYWFNPVEILMSELLAGATIALPAEVIQILDILRITSNIMYGFFITGTVLSFVMIFVTPVAILSRWWSLPMALTAALNGFIILAATVIATVISIVFKYAATAQSDLNIHADVGVKMFVFMWMATGFAGMSFIIHSALGCCCTSRRDIRIGRKPVKPATEKSAADTAGTQGSFRSS